METTRKRPPKVRCRGFLLAELIVSVALLGLIITGLAVSMNGFSMVNDYQWARQRCTAAAQAQLDSLVATGSPIEPVELQRLWRGVEVSLERSPGAAPWEGLELIHVTATTQAGSKKVTVHLARYRGRTSPRTQVSSGCGGAARHGQRPTSDVTSLAPVGRRTMVAEGGRS